MQGSFKNQKKFQFWLIYLCGIDRAFFLGVGGGGITEFEIYFSGFILHQKQYMYFQVMNKLFVLALGEGGGEHSLGFLGGCSVTDKNNLTQLELMMLTKSETKRICKEDKGRQELNER